MTELQANTHQLAQNAHTSQPLKHDSSLTVKGEVVYAFTKNKILSIYFLKHYKIITKFSIKTLKIMLSCKGKNIYSNRGIA